MQTHSVRCFGVLLIVSVALFGPAPTLPATESEQPRYLPDGRLLDGDADWVSSNHDWLAFGSGERVTIATVRPALRLDKVWSLDRPATDGLVIGSSLYFVRQSDAGDELVVADLSAAIPSPRPIHLNPIPRGSLRIAQMDDYLLVAEDGLGVRVLQLPGHRHAAHQGHDSGALAAIGLLAIEEPIHALGVSLRTIYVATEEHLVEIHARVPSLPTLARRIPLERGVHALGANNNTVYLLSDDGLRTLDVSQGGASPDATLDSGVRGNSLGVLGRTVYVAAGDAGLQRFRDSSIRAATFVVAVGDTFFNPGGPLNIAINDTVQWQKPSTIGLHNVFSCNALQVGCLAQTATQVFTSGAVTTLPFNFSHTFTLSGNNPYLCQTHTTLMTGDIVVFSATPPVVPDGGGGFAPMLVSKLNAGGVDLSLSFDTSCPSAVNHDLIFGGSGTLPPVLGATYTPSGSRCAIGASPFTWSASPVVPPGDFVWWILVADDGARIEGSWGQDIGGGERNGPGTNGASNLCSHIDKDLTNICGQ